MCPGRKCKYISCRASDVKGHISCMHPKQSIPIIKIVGYPGSKQINPLHYVGMTHAKLHQKDPKLAQQALYLFYKHNCNNRVHFCGLTIESQCDYVSVITTSVHKHIKRNHPVEKPVQIYKITEYPSKPMWVVQLCVKFNFFFSF